MLGGANKSVNFEEESSDTAPSRKFGKQLRRLIDSWRSGHVADMVPFLHEDIVMKYPGFAGPLNGTRELIAGFEEFCKNARVLEYIESDEQIDIIGNAAVVTFRFEMLYERPSYRERSRGRDLWVFERGTSGWVAVWRTGSNSARNARPSESRISAA